MLPRESQTTSAGPPAASSEPDEVSGTVPGAATDGHRRRGPTRLRHTRRVAETVGSEARIEVLGDRIELLEYTLNAYIDRIDAVATHATRISVDRLTPVVEKLGRILDENRATLQATVVGDDMTGRSDASLTGSGRDADGPSGELAVIAERLKVLETRVASLPDRIRIAAAPPLPSGDAETRSRSHLIAALTSLGRQHDGLKSHLNERLDALEAVAAQGSIDEMSKRLASCEARIARLPETVQDAMSASMQDPAAVAGSLDRLREAMTAMAERQAEAHASLIDRLDMVEARLSEAGASQSSHRLDAIEARIAALPDRIAVAHAPPALADAEAQRSATARVFSALSALSRQHEDLKGTVEQRLGTLEALAAETSAVQKSTANAVADQLKHHLREITARPSPSDGPAMTRTASQRDRNLTVSLARIERGIAALKSREKGTPDAPDKARIEAEARTTRILDAISSLRSEVSDGLAAAGMVNSPQQSAIQAALAELLAVAQRNKG